MSLRSSLSWTTLGALALAAALPASAGTVPTLTCRLGKVPATQLVLPYFELHETKSKTDTRLVFANTGPAPLIARVVVHSDLGEPVLSVLRYLTGYDVDRISLRELLYAPPAGALGDDYTTLCDPAPAAAPDEACLAEVRDALLGRPVASAAGQCLGFPHGDQTLRGYATVSLEDGADPNSLWGEFEVQEKKRVFGGALVHVRQSEAPPLGTLWSVAYRGAQAASKKDATTELLVYREGAPSGPFDCTQPPVGPGATQAIAFDDQENAVELAVDAPFLGLAAQRVRVGVDPLPLPFDSGWLYLDLSDAAYPNAWVGALLTEKKAAVLSEGLQLCP